MFQWYLTVNLFFEPMIVQDFFKDVNAWLKRCVFNLVVNWDNESEPRTISGRLFHSLGAKCENTLPPLMDLDILGLDLDILGLTRSLEFGDLTECNGL